MNSNNLGILIFFHLKLEFFLVLINNNHNKKKANSIRHYVYLKLNFDKSL